MTTTTPITVFAANCRGNPANCLYPNRIEITDDASAVAAFSQDIVCAQYRDSYRNVANFLYSNALPADCDNEHSDDPKQWITPEDIVSCYAVTCKPRLGFTLTLVWSGLGARP